MHARSRTVAVVPRATSGPPGGVPWSAHRPWFAPSRSSGRGLHASSRTLDDQTCPRITLRSPSPYGGQICETALVTPRHLSRPKIARDAWSTDPHTDAKSLGLSHAARRVDALWHDDPVSVRDLGDRLGARDRAVRRHLSGSGRPDSPCRSGRRWRRGRDVDTSRRSPCSLRLAGATAYRVTYVAAFAPCIAPGSRSACISRRPLGQRMD